MRCLPLKQHYMASYTVQSLQCNPHPTLSMSSPEFANDCATLAVVRAFEEMCHDPSYSQLSMSIHTGCMILTKQGDKTTFIAMPEENIYAPITLSLFPNSYASFFDEYSIIIERIYAVYGMWLPNPVVNHPTGYVDPAPPLLVVQVNVEECIPIILEFDGATMTWTISEPYDTWDELRYHIEDVCPGSKF